jgi:predicted nucleic acid-binding protein
MQGDPDSIVVDASVAIKWFVEEAETRSAVWLLEVSGALGQLVAPELLVLEGAAVLAKRARQGRVTADYPRRSLDKLRRLPIRLVPNPELLDHAVLLSEALRHPVYDCLYLALARRLDARLATFDNGLANLARVEDRLWRMA